MSQEHVVDFDTYLDIARSFKKAEKDKEVCSDSDQLIPTVSVQYGKVPNDKFNPYPWIDTTSLIQPHRLDSNYFRPHKKPRQYRSIECCCKETIEDTTQYCGKEAGCKDIFSCVSCTGILILLLFLTSNSGRIYSAI